MRKQEKAMKYILVNIRLFLQYACIKYLKLSENKMLKKRRREKALASTLN